MTIVFVEGSLVRCEGPPSLRFVKSGEVVAPVKGWHPLAHRPDDG